MARCPRLPKVPAERKALEKLVRSVPREVLEQYIIHGAHPGFAFSRLREAQEMHALRQREAALDAAAKAEKKAWTRYLAASRRATESLGGPADEWLRAHASELRARSSYQTAKARYDELFNEMLAPYTVDEVSG